MSNHFTKLCSALCDCALEMHSHTWAKIYNLPGGRFKYNAGSINQIKSKTNATSLEVGESYSKGQGARKCCSHPRAAAKRALLEAPHAALRTPAFVLMSFAVTVRPFKNDGKNTKTHPKSASKKAGAD